MEKKIEIIAVDFDGTLCSECYPAIGMPNLPLFALLKGARRQGKKVILWTCRCGDLLEEAVAWCRMFGLVTGVVLLFGIQFQECNAALLTGIVCGLWGILWGSLLIQNRNLVSKNV